MKQDKEIYLKILKMA